MKFARNRMEARWLPSRFDLSFFRLFAYLRLRSSRPVVPVEPHMFATDRHQSTMEVYMIAIWSYVVTVHYSVDVLLNWMGLPLALIVALLAAPVIIHLLFIFSGLCLAPIFVRQASHVPFNSRLIQLVILATSAFALLRGRPVTRIIALVTLVGAAINAVAMLIIFLLRHRVAKLEAEYAAIE